MRNIIVAALIGAGVAQSAAGEDPYLWLEERTGAQALEWAAGESARARAEITGDPRFADHFGKALALFEAEDVIPYGYVQGGYVYNVWQDRANPLGLWRRATVESYKTTGPQWESVLDIDALAAAEGVNWVFGHAECLPPDHRVCLVSLSPDGGDATVYREFDLDERAFMSDGFSLDVSKSSLTYLDADTALLASTLAPEEETTSGYARVLKRWKRGTPVESAETIFEGRPDDLSVGAYVRFDAATGRRDVFIQRAIDFYTFEVHALREDGSTVPVPAPPQLLVWDLFDGQFVFSPSGDWAGPAGGTARAGGLYAYDYDAWRETGEAGPLATLVEPGERRSLLGFGNTRSRLFVSLTDNVRGEILAFRRTHGAWSEPVRLDLPQNGSISIIHSDPDGSSVSFSFEGLITPPTLYWSDNDGETLESVKSLPARFDASGYVAEQFEAVSKDGTRIPYFVARRAGAGAVPTLLYAYGGFQSSMLPWYSGLRGQLWLEPGNAYILANIRGGGEFGPAWHQAALKEKRQNAFDDLAAVAEDAVARGITTPARLAIQGGSNGGLLVGVSITQRPDLFGAAISQVPLLDMLRYTLLPPGASWIAEYGDPAVPEEAEYIAAYSPYQNVFPGGTYPRTLFMTSTADDRVHPGHARKMAARMLEQGHDVLFHEYAEGGHGGSGDIRRQAEWYALEYMFLQRTLEGHADQAAAASRQLPMPAAALPAGERLPDRCTVPAAAPAQAAIRSGARAARQAAARQVCDGKAAANAGTGT